MRYKILVSIVSFTFLILLFINVPAQHTNHNNTVIAYIACDQDYEQPIDESKIAPLKWSAKWDGDRFMHVPGSGVPGEAHPDKIMRYLTWDGTCWEAQWDSNIKRFKHKRVTTGKEHPDKILNYLTWDRSKWTALRDESDNKYFNHIYIAPEEEDLSFFEKVIKFVNKNGKYIEILIKAFAG